MIINYIKYNKYELNDVKICGFVAVRQAGYPHAR